MKNLIQILTILLFTTSCSQVLKDTKTAEAYKNNLAKKSLSEIQSQIKSDTVFLNDLIKYTTFDLQLISHFSSSEKQKPNQSVPEFTLNNDLPKMDEVFGKYCSKFSFEQSFDETYSKDKFRIFGNDRFDYQSSFPIDGSNLKEQKSNIQIAEKQFFYQGKPILENEIGLKRIDSISTDIELKIPVSFEKLTLNQNQKKLKYKNFELSVESIKENTAQIKVPIELYQEIIAFQAYNKEGKRMNSGSISSIPILEISSEIKNQLNLVKEIFSKILNETDEAKAKLLVKEISQKHFDAKNGMADFSDYIKELEKEKRKIEDFGDDISFYEEVAEKGRNVIAPESQLLVVDFTDDIKSLEIFVGTEFNVLKQQKTILYNPKSFYDRQNPNIIYHTFRKGEGLKFGIIDKNGNKLAEAKYEKFHQLGNDYFSLDEKLHYLNKEKGSLVHLSEYSGFWETVKPGYDILEKKSGENLLYGLVKNQKEIIIPFEYSLIKNYGQFLVANNKQYGKKVELFDENFKKIQKDEIQNLHLIDEFISTEIKFPQLFEVENPAHKKALMNSDMQFLTPFKYEFIDPFFEVNNYFIVGIRTQDGRNYLYGIINDKGEEVTPIKFCKIDENLENGKIKFCLNEKDTSMNFEDFLRTYKK